MAKSQTVSIILQAVDKASGVVSKIANSFGGLKQKADEAAGAGGNLSNAIAFGMAKYNAAIGLAQTGIGKLQGMIQEASSLQLENMSAAQTFAAVAGRSFEEGAAFVDNLTAELSKAAAVLPGATKDYVALGRSIQDNLIDAFKGSDGKLKDMAGFENALMSISKSFGVLSAASNVPIGNTALGLTKALSGGSISELRQIQAFEQNPALLNELEKRLQKVGAKSLKDLDMKARVALIREVGEKFVDSGYQKRAAQTLDGLWQGFISNWFDPNTGVFGLMRDLDPQTKGVQSAFLATNDIMKSLLGEGGLYEQVSGLLSDMGIGIDPMRILRDGIVWLDGWVKQLSAGITSIRSFVKGGGDIAGGLANAINNFDSLFDLATIGAQLNSSVAAISQQLLGVVNAGAIAIGEWLNALKPTAGAEIGAAIGIFTGNLVGQIIDFVQGLDWGAILVAIGRGAIQIIGAIGGFILGFSTTVQNRIIEGVVQVGQGLIDGFTSLLRMVGEMIKTKIAEAGQAIKNAPGNILSEIGYGISGTAQSAAEAVGIVPKYMGAIGKVPNAADGFFGALSREMAAMPTGASPVIANTSETILTPGMLKNLVTGSVAAGAATGINPGMLRGLVSASIGPSSIDPAMIKGLISGGVGGVATPVAGGSTFAPSIVVNAGIGGNGEAIAKEVLRYLEIFFEEHVSGSLA